MLTELECRRAIAVALLELGVSQKKAAAYCHVGVYWVNKAIDEHDIPRNKTGRPPKVLRSDWEKLFDK